ncbi:hypothetical protein [Chakrabartyella piscis]|uniref:hypothetical protein n=1 Tax=Chakrabartyella piscis TaxID=2918914 RepID=UPI002958D75D|nr:hypothetical protein [Chakrabartyella piscis]
MCLQNEDVSRSVTLFFSFDLVNCTQYKSVHEGTWASGVSAVMGYIINTFTQKEIDGYRFWKVLGDEVIFTKNIPYMYELGDILSEIYNELLHFNIKIKNMQIGDAETAKFLGVKATAWIADLSATEKNANNVYIEYKINENQLQSEYLGTDIDAGFRISKFTSYNRLVISFEIAALFLQDRMLYRKINRIHFVGYRQLKGIWNQEPYPIFMYHDHRKTSFKDSILDASDAKVKILEEYVQEMELRETNPQYSCYEEQLLVELCENPMLHHKVEILQQCIKNQTNITTITSMASLKVHYSVICYAVEDEQVKILVTKDRQGNLGFGGAVMHHNLQYLDTMYLYYQEQFGVELSFEKDVRYNDPIPLVISNYTTTVEEETLKGTVFLAKIDLEKLWGDLSEEYETMVYNLEDVPEFVFFDCVLNSNQMLDTLQGITTAK